MTDRRSFLKSAAAAGSMGLIRQTCSFAAERESTDYFGVHPFVESHPEAVFIMLTDVGKKTDSQAIKKTGGTLVQSLFVRKSQGKGSIPLSHKIAIKPNLTNSFTSKKHFRRQASKYPLEYGMGIITDPYFVEGIIESMKGLGISGSQFHIREVNCPWDFGPRGYNAVAERTGADIRDQNAEIGKISKDEVNWVNVPGGWIHKKIPYLWPINTPDSFLLNIAKFKAHGMGITLCCKNHQGSIARNYQHFCGAFRTLKKLDKKHVVRKFEKKCKENFERHLAQGIPRWDRKSRSDNGLRMDVWATRTLDNISASPHGLCIIEGVYGRDGDGFLSGPNKGDISDKEAWDYMTNIVIFGKNPLLVDNIGHWLAGHEPGNFGLFHLAMERGMSDVLNPMDIPVYLWKDGEAALTPLSSFERKPLKTYYLRRDYNGQNEPRFHLVDEPFDYSTVPVKRSSHPESPKARMCRDIILDPADPRLPVECTIPGPGHVFAGIYDSSLKPVKHLFDGRFEGGSHMAVWNTKNHAPGTYYCRFRFRDFERVEQIRLV